MNAVISPDNFTVEDSNAIQEALNSAPNIILCGTDELIKSRIIANITTYHFNDLKELLEHISLVGRLEKLSNRVILKIITDPTSPQHPMLLGSYI